MSLSKKEIEANYHKVIEQIQQKIVQTGRSPNEVQLVVVSKTFSAEAIQFLYEKGVRDFGESRVQEYLQKKSELPDDINWHFIGTLQTNKVSKIIPGIAVIHSVDKIELAEKIAKNAAEKNCLQSILLQVNLTGEKSKHGLNADEWERKMDQLNALSHLQIAGLMTIGPLKNNVEIRSCFRTLYQLRERWKTQMKNPSAFSHLSMGMSNDFSIAIEEGATLLRIGSLVFGYR